MFSMPWKAHSVARAHVKNSKDDEMITDFKYIGYGETKTIADNNKNNTLATRKRNDTISDTKIETRGLFFATSLIPYVDRPRSTKFMRKKAIANA
jgi:hypothetical protein